MITTVVFLFSVLPVVTRFWIVNPYYFVISTICFNENQALPGLLIYLDSTLVYNGSHIPENGEKLNIIN